MHRKLLTALASACALAAAMVGPAMASASTLTLYDSNGAPSSHAYFESDSTTVSFGGFTFQCGALTLGTEITQNQADPVTLQLGAWSGSSSLASCPSGISYSNIQFTAAMQFNANGTGALPLRVTETWNGGTSCVRQGTLTLTYTPNQSVNQRVGFDGYLNRVSGSISCPPGARLQGTFGGEGASDAPTDEAGLPISWVVTP